jgi:sec-independent protein translocase protein TatC
LLFRKFMFYKYLLEIKYRAFFSFIAWISLILNCYFFKETLLYTFIKFNSFYNNYEPTYFLITNVTEVFTTYLQLSYFIANQITFLFICYQIFLFISTGLYKFEYAYFKTTSIIIVIFWVLFVWVLNYTIFPVSWNFFLQFQNFMFAQNLTFYFEAKLNEYWVFYITIYYLCCFAYQLMVLFWIFLSLFKTNFLIIKRLRKILYFAFFVIATIVTPPEVTHQLITSICIIIIYELILISILLKIEFTHFR